MGNEIKQFDASEAMRSVKEKIKDAFVSLIPEEQWNDMVKKNVDSYFNRQSGGYGNPDKRSQFENDVYEVLSAEVKERTKAYLSANFQEVWYQNGVPAVNAKIEEFVVKNAAQILANMINNHVLMAIQNMKYNM